MKKFALTLANYFMKHGEVIDATTVGLFDAVDSETRTSIADAVLEVCTKQQLNYRA